MVFFGALAPSAHCPCSPVVPVGPVHPVDGPLGVRPLAVVVVAVRVDGGGLGRPAAVAAGDEVLRHSGYNLEATRGGQVRGQWSNHNICILKTDAL